MTPRSTRPAKATKPAMKPARFESLLSPGWIGSLELRNRIIMSPMGSNLCEPDGHLSERILRYYEERARGGAAMVIVGVGAITFPDGACNPNQIAISDDVFLPGLSELTRRVHGHGAKAAIQLQHAGKVAVRDMVAGRPMWVPSAPVYKAGDLTRDLTAEELDRFTRDLRRPGAAMKYHEMSSADVATLVACFAKAAVRARSAGFDGVELHAGHGYILSSFLSAASNRREDAYGGSLENRARFLVEAIGAVKAAVGADFPVWCRLDAHEFRTEGGITIEDATGAAQLAAGAGADAIHVSAYADSSIGAAFTEAPLVHAPSGYVPYAEAIRQCVDVPVIAVGRIEPEAADALIERGGADFIAMARKLLADPELPKKLGEGRPKEIRPCIYCYTCVGRIFLNQSSACAVNPTSGREFEMAREEEPAAEPRRVLIVGGGPGGLEVARIATLRGHAVTLCERADRLGGALWHSTLVNPDNARLLAWLEDQVALLGVDVRLGTNVDRDTIGAFEADVIVLALGAKRPLPNVPGADGANVWRLDELRAPDGTPCAPGNRIVVIGGGGPGLAVAAHWLADASSAACEITVLEAGPVLGSQLSPPRRWRVLAQLREAGATLLTSTTLESLSEGRARYRVAKEVHEVPFDTVVLAAGWQPDDQLEKHLASANPQPGADIVTVGDCRALGLIEGAMADAGQVARAL